MSQTPDKPPHYDDLDAVRAAAEAMLADAHIKADHAFRKPFLATRSANGLPKARIVILRYLDWGARTARLHTDARSDKIAEIEACPDVSMAFYDPATEIQLQLSGQATVHRDSDFADHAWHQASLPSRRAYLAEGPSGTRSPHPVSGLPKDVEGTIPHEIRIAEGRRNFAAIEILFHQLDWLYLSSSGNRRARFEFDDGAWAGTWLVP